MTIAMAWVIACLFTSMIVRLANLSIDPLLILFMMPSLCLLCVSAMFISYNITIETVGASSLLVCAKWEPTRVIAIRETDICGLYWKKVVFQTNLRNEYESAFLIRNIFRAWTHIRSHNVFVMTFFLQRTLIRVLEAKVMCLSENMSNDSSCRGLDGWWMPEVACGRESQKCKAAKMQS